MSELVVIGIVALIFVAVLIRNTVLNRRELRRWRTSHPEIRRYLGKDGQEYAYRPDIQGWHPDDCGEHK